MDEKTTAISGPCREKHWDELDDSQKIIRLREVVKQLERRLESISKTAGDAHCVALQHEHGAKGDVLMAPDSFNRNGTDVCRRRDEKYF